ncbi:MAG TPA: transporter [Rhizomicrobium sp.]|nr:transporter [Rhizomicrobium sp.]
MSILLLFLLSPSAGRAQSTDTSGYSLFDAVPDDQLRPFCTDRPTKGTGPCTVDAGHLQIESDIFNATLQNSDGVVTDTYLYTNPNFRLGLTQNLDVELNFSPYVEVVTHDHATGARTDDSGFGDMYLRVKTSLVGNGQGTFSAALDPFLKIPTAPLTIGNGAVEGGIVVPLQYALSDVWSLSLVPELDILKDQFEDGHHTAAVAAFSVTRAISAQVSATAEIWQNASFDPFATVEQYSFDVAGTWQPLGARDLQLDAGANFGLNHETAAVQFYLGISHRF